ncbi:hypothetical protein SAMN05444064_101551 [Pseudomonas syringae]|uniref:hypothetical protein n=1 Tax=Pseudomonas syringae TaxID=317 RepID=UPI000895A582|nr:hypothetical protein [Pseudomonas syringae]SDW14905.1 hypothetical protein SAMN05444514_101553 [Pseudomonas syringae]SFL45439.1 hypothetical protein SAMN05444064_101551 [Pseudomonas syringae]
MTSFDPTSFVNVTPFGIRQKNAPSASTAHAETFAQALKHANHEYGSSQCAKKSPRGGELKPKLIEHAKNAPEEAAALAKNYAYNSLNGEGVDLSDYPIIRYCATGEIVTSESSAYFQKTWGNIKIERVRLYELEHLKGTPPAEILEKILNFNDALPERFRDIANW